MEAIKKKMQHMKNEKDLIQDKIDLFEYKNKALDIRLDKTLEEASLLTRKITSLDNEFETAKEALLQTNQKLEERQATLQSTESEVNTLNRKVNGIEEDYEKSEQRLVIATTKNAEASEAADNSDRMKKVLENRLIVDDERMESLEGQLKDARFLAEEADRKYDEVSTKLAEVELNLERAEERADTGEAKIVELEEELCCVGNNLKSLGNAQEHAKAREKVYKERVTTLTKQGRSADARVFAAERTITKLQKEVDRIEDELSLEKEKFKGLTDELDQTFNEIGSY